MTRKDNPHWGTSLDDFLAEESLLEAVRTKALTRSFDDLVQRGAAADPAFRDALRREGIDSAPDCIAPSTKTQCR